MNSIQRKANEDQLPQAGGAGEAGRPDKKQYPSTAQGGTQEVRYIHLTQGNARSFVQIMILFFLRSTS